MSRTITFVTPRYGREVVGGAEGGARAIASRAAADGWKVRVLTTCAISSVTWADHYEPGEVAVDGVEVHRFPVDRPRHREFDRRSVAVLASPATASLRDALQWIEDQGPTSAALLDAVAAVDDGPVALYPYLYHPTVMGSRVARVPTVLHAAAHREAPLLLPVFDELFASVRGLAHHTRSEQNLVDELFAATRNKPQVVLGLPVDEPPESVDALEPFEEPTLLYLGRVDRGKGTDELVERFSARRRKGGIGRLVIAGPVVHQPADAPGVEVLGAVSDEERWSLLGRCDALVNPSPHESFSLVVLEAWLAGTPVLVNGWCAPLVEHCRRSGGGLSYLGHADFVAAADRLLARDGVAEVLAAAGAGYVRSEFSWPAVRARYEALLDRIG